MWVKKTVSLLGEFLKVWCFMFFTFLVLKAGCNLLLFGIIDLRRLAILETLLVPLGQSIAFWLVVKTLGKPIMKPGPPI